MSNSRDVIARLVYLLELAQLETSRFEDEIASNAPSKETISLVDSNLAAALESLRQTSLTGPGTYIPNASIIKCGKCGDYKVQK